MEQKLLSIFQEALEIEGRELQLEDSFRDFDEWDSLAQLSLIALLDENFEVQIEEKELAKLNSIGDFLPFLQQGE